MMCRRRRAVGTAVEPSNTAHTVVVGRAKLLHRGDDQASGCGCVGTLTQVTLGSWIGFGPRATGPSADPSMTRPLPGVGQEDDPSHTMVRSHPLLGLQKEHHESPRSQGCSREGSLR